MSQQLIKMPQKAYIYLLTPIATAGTSPILLVHLLTPSIHVDQLHERFSRRIGKFLTPKEQSLLRSVFGRFCITADHSQPLLDSSHSHRFLAQTFSPPLIESAPTLHPPPRPVPIPLTPSRVSHFRYLPQCNRDHYRLVR